MPKSQANQGLLLGAIARQLAERHMCDARELTEDLNKLDELVRQGVDWGAAATDAATTRHELYRWYHDTFQRNLYGPVNQSDIQIIRQALLEAGQNNVTLSRQFQKELKTKLSREYHRNSFTVAFNNQKRLVETARGHNLENGEMDALVRELEAIVTNAAKKNGEQ